MRTRQQNKFTFVNELDRAGAPTNQLRVTARGKSAPPRKRARRGSVVTKH
jgi:hypothetical protein